MRRYVWITVLVAMVVSTVAFSQERDERKARPRRQMQDNLRLRERQLELEQREQEMEFQQQMRQLELEERRLELEHKRQALKSRKSSRGIEPQRRPEHKAKGPGDPKRAGHIWPRKKHPFMAVFLIVHVLLSIWVYQDMRNRNAGSGIWIVVTLLSGFFGALLYAVVRLGDIRKAES